MAIPDQVIYATQDVSNRRHCNGNPNALGIYGAPGYTCQDWNSGNLYIWHGGTWQIAGSEFGMLQYGITGTGDYVSSVTATTDTGVPLAATSHNDFDVPCIRYFVQANVTNLRVFYDSGATNFDFDDAVQVFPSLVTLNLEWYFGYGNVYIQAPKPLLSSIYLLGVGGGIPVTAYFVANTLPSLSYIVAGAIDLDKDSLYNSAEAATRGGQYGGTINTATASGGVTGASLFAREELENRGWTLIL